MRRIMMVSTLLLVFAVVFAAAPAWATSPHFLNNTLSCTYSASGGTITFEATGTVAGLGNATDWVTLSGTASVTCQSNGQGGTQTTSAHQFKGSSPVVSTSNGNYPFDVTATTSCPGSQTAHLTGTITATLTLSSGPNGTGTVFDTATVRCTPQ